MTFAAGSDALIGVILDALGAAGGRMILQVPNYYGWSHYAMLRKLALTAIPIGLPNTTGVGFAELLGAAEKSEPSLVVVSNPNSPSGHLLMGHELQHLAHICSRHGHLLVVDECFAAFAPVNHFASLGQYDHIVLVRSYSKSLGLAGARIAVSITSRRIARILSAYRTESAVSGPALHLLERLLSRPQELESIWRDIVAACFGNFRTPISVIRGQRFQ
ncbi:aminotransferase class I/II-fold pyridoxal phosphate-dependent enzyme [Bradyrhizobium sp. Arg62]|uniref:aminotransferase class I/II-fold pyridoxal phosphate-dependent enzyme n=1 Tax=Bradyrhizobium brasilense TaxID=1419277 RepID=UPI001E2C0917|nr:aminotransferase class I/II-fold pyridoxal phosphate-dependent enzyme [Bradyrhizobium brasilense]MCC8950224.1 aminotransferase class I/II-fold pyridoxal phosphate-dependent enzyme [Bradyrhizobium brasilense]